MKKIVLASALILSCMAAKETAAVTDADLAKKATTQTEKLDKIVGLTPEQKAQAYTINLENDKLIEEFKEKLGDGTEAFGEKKKRVNDKRVTELGALMRPDQQTKWVEAQKEMKHPDK